LLFGGITRSIGRLQVFQPLGMVDDVRDAYGVMDLVVNPMIGGTGLKIKTVEALAFGRPVLSTKAGGAGLEAIHPDLLHEDVPALIARLRHLIGHPEEVVALAAAMRIGYQAFHDDVAGRLRDLVASIGSLSRV
jgi:glycosyltransferase involved in cell wall biosynthesis